MQGSDTKSAGPRHPDRWASNLVKIFRGNLCHLDPADSSLSLEFFCSKHEVFLKELLEITLRPTATLLREAAGLV